MFLNQSLPIFLSLLASANAFTTAGFGTNFVNKAAVYQPKALTPAPLRRISFTSLNESTEAETEAAAEVEVEEEPTAEVEEEPTAEVEEEPTAEVTEEPTAAVAEETTAAVEEAIEETPAPVAEEETPKKVEEKVEDDINCVAYVVNLSYDTPFALIRETFQPYGTVGKVFVPRDRNTGRNKGIAFVTMATQEERDAAIEALNESSVDGRTVYVDKAKPRGEPKPTEDLTKLYVGNISYETGADDLKTTFSEYGSVQNIYLPTDRETGEPRGFAFLAMKPADAEKAIEELNGTELMGRDIVVNISLPRGTKAPHRKNETKLYVGNISFDTEEGTLQELFGEYGPVIDLYVPTDQHTGRPRGFAFVTLEPEMAERCIEECDGYEVDGRMLRVNEAQAKGSGGGGGGGNNYAPTNDW